jgi:hypothetical protein
MRTISREPLSLSCGNFNVQMTPCTECYKDVNFIVDVAALRILLQEIVLTILFVIAFRLSILSLVEIREIRVHFIMLCCPSFLCHSSFCRSRFTNMICKDSSMSRYVDKAIAVTASAPLDPRDAHFFFSSQAGRMH